MADAESEMRIFVDGMDWRESIREEIAGGRSTRDIAREHGVSQRQVQRWANGSRGTSADRQQAIRQQAAARAMSGGRLNIKWEGDVEYETKKMGKRGQPNGGPFNSMPGVGDALAQGDYAGAGEAFNRSLTAQYGAPELRVRRFSTLRIDW